MKRAGTTLRTAERAFAFMEAVAESPQPLKIKDIAARLGLNITTAYHLLNTLQQAGYVVRDGDGSLRIGGRVGLLHQGLLRQLVLGRDLYPVVAELGATTRETAYLSSRSGNSLVVQALVEANQAVRAMGLHIGFSGAEHVRASGKAVLAFLDDTNRQLMLAKSVNGLSARERSTIEKRLVAEFEEIRVRGWALDDQMFQDDVCCVAAPFFQSDGSVAGSMGISMPAGRFEYSHEAITVAVCTAAKQASDFLGHHVGPSSRDHLH